MPSHFLLCFLVAFLPLLHFGRNQCLFTTHSARPHFQTFFLHTSLRQKEQRDSFGTPSTTKATAFANWWPSIPKTSAASSRPHGFAQRPDSGGRFKRVAERVAVRRRQRWRPLSPDPALRGFSTRHGSEKPLENLMEVVQESRLWGPFSTNPAEPGVGWI